MTKADLVQAVAQKSELVVKDAEIIVSEIFQAMIEALQNGEEIELRGFGCFRQRQRNARKGRNPKTGKAVKVKAKRVTYFKVGKELRATLLKQSVASQISKAKTRVKAKAAATEKTTSKNAAKRVKK